MDLLKARVWFADAWGKIGQLGTLCVKADEAEISAAGVELLLLSVELASKKGNANVGGLRAGDNMAVVNGRLQNMEPAAWAPSPLLWNPYWWMERRQTATYPYPY